MDISQITDGQFVDLFGGTANTPNPTQNNNNFGFGMQNQDIDLLNTSATNTTTASTTDTTTEASTTETTTQLEEVDLLGTQGKEGDDEKKGAGRPNKYDFSDMSGYFEDRIKKGLFVEVTTENEKGEAVTFIPKTPEEFDEVIDLQVNYKIEQKQKEIEEGWYKTKSPAWQVVAQYAEKVDNPAELVPFLQGVRNIETVASINESEIEGAEKLVRLHMQNKGEPQAVIDTQVEALKTTNKLVEAATAIKPVMIQSEQQRLAQMNQQKEKEFNDYRNMVVSIRDNAIKAIETPIGNLKLKTEEKAAIYDLIGEPDEDKGYKIYNAIDKLFDEKDFQTLRDVAFFLANKEAFLNYVSTNAANKTADDLKKKLRIAADGKSASNKDQDTNPPQPVIRRDQYQPSTPRFGRG